MRLPVHSWSFSFSLVAAVAVIGLISSLVLPYETSLALVQEGGAVETATVVFYLLALAVVGFGRPPGLDRVSRIAISILLLACAARELDLHSALFGISILKANFYRRFATGSQIACALLIIFPVVLSIIFLLKRHFRWLLNGIRHGRPAAITALCIVITLVVAKTLDRALAILRDFGVEDVTGSMRVIQLALEEPLEMTLPLLVIIAIVQEWHGDNKVPLPASDSRAQVPDAAPRKSPK